MDLRTIQEFNAFIDYAIKSLSFGWANDFDFHTGNLHFFKCYYSNDRFVCYFKNRIYCIYPCNVVGIELLKREITLIISRNQGWEMPRINFFKNLRKELRKYE